LKYNNSPFEVGSSWPTYMAHTCLATWWSDAEPAAANSWRPYNNQVWTFVASAASTVRVPAALRWCSLIMGQARAFSIVVQHSQSDNKKPLRMHLGGPGGTAFSDHMICTCFAAAFSEIVWCARPETGVLQTYAWMEILRGCEGSRRARDTGESTLQ
jgi:hypothetical protein